ncbi:hypothetical protein [Bradyrhizobium sp. STM 3561]|uniref:hypothetical protein n=1 Tax=Bradyrhizobium sp. STM 3561 TaxID=578923 RepID=UPI00388E732C
MSNIIAFPPASADDENERNAEAFRDLESDICDCLCMSEIAVQMMPDETDEHLMFAVRQTAVMLERFKKRYYSLWHGEERPA